MARSDSGGWRFVLSEPESYNAYCYAGNGCTILDNRLNDPFKMQDVESVIANTEDSCGIARVADRSKISTENSLCPGDDVQTEGSVLVCRNSSTQAAMLCGEGAFLAVTMEGPTTSNFVVEQFDFVNDDFFTLSRTISAFSADADCAIQGNKLTCAPGLTRLLVSPRTVRCTGGSFDKLLNVRCNAESGLSQIGCCPATASSDSPTSNSVPTTSPLSTPTTSSSDATFLWPTLVVAVSSLLFLQMLH